MVARPLVGPLLACAAAVPAWAQTVVVEPAATMRCLMPPQPELGQPEYPFAEWKGQAGGRVLVELEFTRPDARPAVKVIEHEGPEVLVDAVEKHVRKLRVPCLEAGEGPARLRQEYHFRPDRRGVVSGADSDPDQARRKRLAACVMHVRSRQIPDYPMSAERAGIQGRVVARLSFFASDQPPRSEVHATRAAHVLQDAVASFVQGYRMPCHEGGAVQLITTYVFRLEGDVYGFKDISFRQYVGSIKHIELQRVSFDTTSMGCPFDVRLQYLQPYLSNSVGEMGNHDPARAPLLQWLRDSELRIPPRSLDAVFGDSFVLTVPCIKIDLKPKE